MDQLNMWGLRYFANDPLYFLIFPYCLMQPICRIWAKESAFYEKNKEICKKIMAGYNLIMTIFSLVCASVMIYCLMNLRKGVYSVGHYDDEDVGNTYNTVAYYFYLSKYVEFLDTFFLILCNNCLTGPTRASMAAASKPAASITSVWSTTWPASRVR